MLSGAVAVLAVLLVAALDHPLTLMVLLSNATDATVRTTLLETALRLEMKPQSLPPRSATNARRPAISLGKQRYFFFNMRVLLLTMSAFRDCTQENVSPPAE